MPGAREVAIWPQLQAAWTVAVAASTGLVPLVFSCIFYPDHDKVLESEWCLWLVDHLWACEVHRSVAIGCWIVS